MFDSWGWEEWTGALAALAWCIRAAYLAGQINGLVLAGFLAEGAHPDHQKKVIRRLKERRRVL